jgi:hypothetical protein
MLPVSLFSVQENSPGYVPVVLFIEKLSPFGEYEITEKQSVSLIYKIEIDQCTD